MKKKTLRVVSVALVAATVLSTILSVPIFAAGKSSTGIQEKDRHIVANTDENTPKNLGGGWKR